MTRTKALIAASCAALLFPICTLAQERGRTDGPEGSEYGKGGYSRASAGRFSLGLDWGASFGTLVGGGAPLFLGATGSFWMDDWFLVDVSYAHTLDSDRNLILVGPRLRTGFEPISLSLGVKAGVIFLSGGQVAFGLAPNVGADLLLRDKYLLGLQFSWDIPVASVALSGYRIFMNIGYRF